MRRKREKMDARSILNLKADLEEYHRLVANLKNIKKVKKATLQVRKGTLAQKGKEAKRVLLRDKVNETFGRGAFEDIDRLIGMTHQSYQQYKGIEDKQHNTHQFITDQATALLATDSTIADVLHTYCTYPDEPKSDMADLIFEGHFYGKTGSGIPGNFLADTFPKEALRVMAFVKQVRFGADEDMHEHAVSNFTQYFNQVLRLPSPDQKYFYLGVSAHFLQDLTAPHHAGNYPALPYVDHYFFEQFASRYVYDHPRFNISRSAYKKFKSRMASDPNEPESYALEVNSMAVPFIPYIEPDSRGSLAMGTQSPFSLDAELNRFNKSLLSGQNEKWEKAIVGAVPLAIYATAYLFETALKEVR